MQNEIDAEQERGISHIQHDAGRKQGIALVSPGQQLSNNMHIAVVQQRS